MLGAVIAALVVTAVRPNLEKANPKNARAAAAACPSIRVVAAPSASESNAPAMAATPPKNSLVARAAEGDREAVKLLENRPLEERSAAEVVALARAQTIEKRKSVAELGRKIQLVSKLLDDPATSKSLRQYADDGEVATELIAALAELPGPAGPDALYRLGPASPQKSAASSLAEQVLYTKDVHAKASPALAVLLELRREQDCSKMATLLEKARTQADRRAIGSVARLENKYGCGPKKRDDCWACLRKTKLIRDTLKELGKRKSG